MAESPEGKIDPFITSAADANLGMIRGGVEGGKLKINGKKEDIEAIGKCVRIVTEDEFGFTIELIGDGGLEDPLCLACPRWGKASNKGDLCLEREKEYMATMPATAPGPLKDALQSSLTEEPYTKGPTINIVEVEEDGGEEDGEEGGGEEGGGEEGGEEGGGEEGGEEGGGEEGGEEGGGEEGGGEGGGAVEGIGGAIGGLVDGAVDKTKKAIDTLGDLLGHVFTPDNLALPAGALGSIGGAIGSGISKTAEKLKGLLPTDVHGPNLGPMLTGMRGRLIDAWNKIREGLALPAEESDDDGDAGPDDEPPTAGPERRRKKRHESMPWKRDALLATLLTGVYIQRYVNHNGFPSRDYYYPWTDIEQTFERVRDGERKKGWFGRRGRDEDPLVSKSYLRELFGYSSQIPLEVVGEVGLAAGVGLIASEQQNRIPDYNCFELGYVPAEIQSSSAAAGTAGQVSSVPEEPRYMLVARLKTLNETTALIKKFMSGVAGSPIVFNEEDRVALENIEGWVTTLFNDPSFLETLNQMHDLFGCYHSEISKYRHLVVEDYSIPQIMNLLYDLMNAVGDDARQSLLGTIKSKIREFKAAVKYDNGPLSDEVKSNVVMMNGGMTVVDAIYMNDVLSRQTRLRAAMCTNCPISQNCRVVNSDNPLGDLGRFNKPPQETDNQPVEDATTNQEPEPTEGATVVGVKEVDQTGAGYAGQNEAAAAGTEDDDTDGEIEADYEESDDLEEEEEEEAIQDESGSDTEAPEPKKGKDKLARVASVTLSQRPQRLNDPVEP